MLDLDIRTIAFQILNFCLLAVALYFILFRPAIRRMKEQAEEKEREEKETQRDRQEAKRLRAELEDRLAGVEEEATALVVQARERAEAERAELLQGAQAEAEHILAEAHASAGQLWEQATADLHAELLDTIVGISGMVIGQAAPPEVHDALIQELSERIYDMGRTEMQQVETLRRSLGEREPTAYVTTAHPLSPEQQGLLARTFAALADRNVNLDVTTDPALAAGVQVRLGDVIVANSISDRLQELREIAAQALEQAGEARSQ